MPPSPPVPVVRLPVSAGLGLMPVFDPNNFWDPTTRQRKVVGQAVGVGGDRWNLQLDDGTDVHAVNKNGTMAGRAPSPPWCSPHRFLRSP